MLDRVTFAALLLALQRDLVRRRDNGEFSERGLASLSGYSQPHIHHLLCGARRLTPAVADEILSALGLSLSDLIKSHSD